MLKSVKMVLTDYYNALQPFIISDDEIKVGDMVCELLTTGQWLPMTIHTINDIDIHRQKKVIATSEQLGYIEYTEWYTNEFDVEEFNTYALGLISRFVNGSIAPLDSIREINTRPLIPRPWEADIPTSITNILCSFGLIGFVIDEVIVDLLNIPGTNINTLSSDGNTPLIVALANKNRILAVSYIRKGADVNLRNTRGSTPLHWAASQGLAGPLKLLLDTGAEKDALTLATDPWEPLATPLHWACKAGQPDTAMALLTAGANLGLRDGNGQSTLDLAKEKPSMSGFVKLLEVYKERTGANMGGRRTRRNRKTRRLRNKKHYSRAK